MGDDCEQCIEDSRWRNRATQDVLADFNVAMALETEDRRLDPPTVLAGVAGLLHIRSSASIWWPNGTAGWLAR